MVRTRVALPLALVVALTACSAGTDPASEATPTAPVAESPTPQQTLSSTPAATPEATAENVRPTAPPAQSIAAGTVADGTRASTVGEDSAEITFVRDGGIAVVVVLDCATCTGPTVLTAPDRRSPLGEAEGALEGHYLVDVFKDTDPEQSLWLQAQGEWSVDLLSWNDLPLLEGPVNGTGSTVMFLDGESSTANVTWTPAHDQDVFQGRFFGVSVDDAVMFGDSEAFSTEVELGLPGVIAITTAGQWSITPTP